MKIQIFRDLLVNDNKKVILMESRLEFDPKTDSSHSWMRWSSESHLWSKSSKSKSDSNSDQLFVFGYSCKLFRDDERAQQMDCGQHLIPWMSSETLLIDRFDVRGYLNDLKQYEPNKNTFEELTPEEREIERLCDEERFADLKNDDDNNHDEEIKRLHLALADATSYHQMDYKYDDNPLDTNSELSLSQKEEDELIVETDTFKLPSGLSPPEGISLPDSQKLHNIIEKTASFVSQHGTQMEIIVKTKQSSNKNFEFLSFDSALNPYYRFLLSNIKSGKYIPKQSEDSDKSDSDDSDDDHYLHPSLLGSAKRDLQSSEPFNIPNLLRATDNHDSYSQLVKSFKDKFPTNEEEKQETIQSSSDTKLSSVVANSPKNDNNSCDKNTGANTSQQSWSSLLPSPPPEIELIIEKLAQHVAKNGEQFELSIRKLGETRFEFVNPGNIYHAHYIRRKLHHLEENRKAQAAQIKLNHKKTANKSDLHLPKAPVSFSISAKDSKSNAQIAQSDEILLSTSVTKRDDERNSNSEITAKRICENALKDKLAYAARERVAKEKQLQEERKRKAAVFLSLIKKQSKEKTKNENTNEKISESVCIYGPELPKPKTVNSQQLSPTIVAVTSPNNSPEINRNEDNGSILLDTVLNNKNFETAKSGSLLPFIVSDKPLKESSSRLSPHKHHRYKSSSSHHKSYKRKRSRSPKSRNNSKSRSPSSSRSSSHSSKKYSNESSKSRSRSRSRSHSRSHRRH